METKHTIRNKHFPLNAFLLVFYFLMLIFAIQQHGKELGISKKKNMVPAEKEQNYFSMHDSYGNSSFGTKIRVYSFRTSQ